MHRDKEIRNSKGGLIHLEKPKYGIMIKDGVVVNEEAYKLFMERMEQNKVAPTAVDPSIIEQAKKREEEFSNSKMKDLENKVDTMYSILEKLAAKLDEK